MANHFLDEEEIVILQESNVTDRTGKTVTLLLTNRNIVEKRYNSQGKETWINKFSLIKLKDNNGKPNILVGKSPEGKTRLELYLLEQELYYQFKAPFGEKKWVAAVTKAYKNLMAEIKRSERQNNGIPSLLSPVKDRFDSTKNAILQKKKKPGLTKMKCPQCGAELAGQRGTEVKCSYCDNVVTMK